MGEDITSTGAVHGGSDAGDEFTLRPRSGLNSIVNLAETLSGGRDRTIVDHSGSGIPEEHDYYEEVEAEGEGMIPAISNLDVDEREYERAYDTGEISSLASNRVAFSDDGKGEVNTTSFQELIERLQSSPSPSRAHSPPLDALRDIPATGGPNEHYLDLDNAPHQPNATAQPFTPVRRQWPTTKTTKKYDPGLELSTLNPRAALAAIKREHRTLAIVDTDSTLNPGSAQPAMLTTPINPWLAYTVDTLLSPPAGYYNPSDRTYTLNLDWAMSVIGAVEFIEGPFMRKVLRFESLLRSQEALNAGLPEKIAGWLRGDPLMEVHRFPAELFKGIPSPVKSWGVETRAVSRG